MRMRLKKHLAERMEKADNLVIDVDCSELNSKLSALKPQYLDFNAIFENSNPTALELGCGFGSFAMQFCERNLNKNLVAVEKMTNVLVVACEQTPASLRNLRYLNISAEYLLTYFRPKSVCDIYLNFSTPFQKKQYANRRLTHVKFLDIYAKLLYDGGKIYFKTDDREFFEFTKQQLTERNWQIVDNTEDLHHSEYVTNNIVTEYESKFVNRNLPIHYLSAKPKTT